MYSEGEDEEIEWTDVEEEDSEGEGEDEQVEEEVSASENEEGTDDEDSRSEGSSEEDEVEEEEWTGLGDSLQAGQDDTAGSPSQALEPKPTSQQPIPGSRYIPPHLRNRQVGSEVEKLSEEQIKLQRQLKGLLNRMSEQNISSILDRVEEVYRDHRRYGAFCPWHHLWRSCS